MNVVCLNCGGAFNKKPWNVKRSKRHFCTRSCANSYNNTQRLPRKPRKRRVHQCNLCDADYTFLYGKTLHRSKRYCLDCKRNLQKTPKGDIRETTIGEIKKDCIAKGKHPTRIGIRTRVACRYWNRHMKENPCKNCGYSLHVELCHIKAVMDFGDSATLKEINDESNILVLCRNCHWEFDNGYLIM